MATVGRKDRHRRRAAESLEEPADVSRSQEWKRWRNRWPFKMWIKPRLDERFCRECSLPYLHGPLPEEIGQFHSGNVAAVLLPKAGWKERYTVRIGRWKPSAGRYFLSEFIPSDEVADLELVVAQLREFLDMDAARPKSTSAVRQGPVRPTNGRPQSRSLKTSPQS